MKNFISILCIALPLLIFGQNQERLSVHYFDIPQELEAEFLTFNKEINQVLEDEGFGKDFYKIYKVHADDKAEKHRYFQISSYTSDKHYAITHDVNEKYTQLLDAFWDSKLAEAFNENRIYRKVYRIENR